MKPKQALARLRKVTFGVRLVAEGKVALAAALKARPTVTHPWLGAYLHLGNRHEIGRKVAAWRRSGNPTLARKLGLLPPPHNPTPSHRPSPHGQGYIPP